MKIAIFSDNYPPATGGTETAVHNFACALAKKGHSVLVCTPKMRGGI